MPGAGARDVSTISGAVSVNIIRLAVTAPFLTGLSKVIGLKRMVLLCMGLLIAGTGLPSFMTTPWQLFVIAGTDRASDGVRPNRCFSR
jgi:cyanate permease